MRKKPEPPADLWAQMDALNEKHGFYRPIAQPPGTITSESYAKQYGISVTPAKQRLKKLVEAGEIEVVGIGVNRKFFYRIKQ